MNKTQISNLQRLGGAFQREWLEGLKQDSGRAAISSIAEMLQFDSTCEGALIELGQRAHQYPLDCVRHMLFAMHSSSAAFELGVHVLRAIDRKQREQAFDAIANIYCNEDPDRWRKHVSRVRRILKSRA